KAYAPTGITKIPTRGRKKRCHGRPNHGREERTFPARQLYMAPAQLLVTSLIIRLALSSIAATASGIPKRAAWLGETPYERVEPSKDKEPPAAKSMSDGCSHYHLVGVLRCP